MLSGIESAPRAIFLQAHEIYQLKLGADLAVLSACQTAAAALRQAQDSLRKQRRWSAPYFWAGFILQGDPS